LLVRSRCVSEEVLSYLEVEKQQAWLFYKCSKKHSCRKETVRLLRWSLLAKYNSKTIFCGMLNFGKV